MRERLDCAVLLTRCTLDWMNPLLGKYAGGRLHLHAYEHVVDIQAPEAHAALGMAGMSLRRYDVCLVPVRPGTLSWTRTALSQAMQSLRTPVLALVQDLTAAGLNDLRGLGVADFLRDPFCGHEARMRIERILDDRRGAPMGAGSATCHVADSAVDTAFYGADPATEKICRNILSYDGAELEAFAMAAASRCAKSNESFRDAKSKVVARFERAYITAALGRHGGNITMAARSAQKHRRAFWALMRKHEIQPEPFREQAVAMQQPAKPACTNVSKLPMKMRHAPLFRHGKSSGGTSPGR